HTAGLPSGITLGGTVSCASVNGGTPIGSTLAAGGTYTIDGSSCSGLSLSGTGSSNYQIAYSGGAFTVSKATIQVSVTGSQTYGSSSPSFGHTESLPSGITLGGTVSCAGRKGSTPNAR